MTVATTHPPVERKAAKTSRCTAWHHGEVALHFLRRVLDVIAGAYSAHPHSQRQHRLELPASAWAMFEVPIRRIVETLGLEIDRRDSTCTHTVYLTITTPTGVRP